MAARGGTNNKSAREAQADTARALRRYDADYLLCRRGNLGHIWEVIGFYKQAGETRRRLECVRCESVRIDRWDADTGERFAPAYKTAEEYKIHWPTEVTAADVRVEVMRRANVYANEENMLAAVTGGTR
jgi:adenylyl- and sulfurtransferase ThiI